MIEFRKHLNDFTRPALRPFEREGWICLDKNEAPFPAFESLEDCLGDLEIAQSRVYPDPYPLYKGLAEFVGVPKEQLLVTFGSEQALRFVFEAVISPGDEVAFPSPTFAMLEVFARTFDARINAVPYSADNTLSVETIVSALSDKTKLLLLANPNNPTGTAFSFGELRQLAQETYQLGITLVVDEAYFHYCDITALPLLEEFNNIIVTRTFSKGWGLAGIRVGYAISSAENITILRKLKPIDEISLFSLIACLNALKNRERILNRNVEQVAKWKKNFQESFPEIVLASQGNFIIVKWRDEKLLETHLEWFRTERIKVKGPFDDACLENCVRFSVGTDEVMSKIHRKMEEMHQ